MALEPAKLSDFRLGGLLGSGATSKVYEATHVASGRPVAIKVLEPSQAGPEMRERFAREALLLAGVQSRYVASIMGFGFEQGQPFLVLERLVGETLDAKLRRDGPVPMGSAVRWIEQLIVAIGDCHAAQVIHRDIKPANLFLVAPPSGVLRDATVKVIDFGVGRLREIVGGPDGITSANQLIGSMGYMAPEQFRDAKTVDYSADLYAIGVVVFRMLTGRLPYVSRSLEAVIRMKQDQPVPRVSSMPGMPQNPMLDRFVEKAMAREPAQRFQKAREMLEHWWNVMPSLEADTTDVMRGMGRVDESYAGPVPRSGIESSAGPEARSERSGAEADDRTIRQSGAHEIRGSDAATPTPRMTADAPPSSIPISVPAATLRHPVVGGLTEDPSDLPTRSDPNLKKLVEQELALRRARGEKL